MEDEYEHLAELMDILEDGFKKIHKRMEGIERKLEEIQVKSAQNAELDSERQKAVEKVLRDYYSTANKSPSPYYDSWTNNVRIGDSPAIRYETKAEDYSPSTGSSYTSLNNLKNVLNKFGG